MKKLFLLSALIFAISCTHENQKIKFDISIDREKSDFGNVGAIDVVAFDDRSQKNLLGEKTFGDEKIQITSNEDLAELLRQKISENLQQKGFKNGLDKTVEIHLESLQYKAVRKFFIGTSAADSAIKIVVKNNKTGEKFTKNFALSINGKHFLAPLEETDAATINTILRDTVLDILGDKSLMRSLAK
ncbi:MAG: hypothetical protein KA100_02085 [Rickettsiales bacterium]|nr:hypothetical protein [Rickettsiales bacterium]